MPEPDPPGDRDDSPSPADCKQTSRTGLASGEPLRSPSFRWFFAGWSVTVAGGAMSPVALAFGVLELTGSARWLSAVLTASMVPMIGMMIVGGGIADRYRRDTVLYVTSLGAGLSQGGVAVLLLTHQDPVLLLPLAAVNGISQALTTPTLRGIVPQLASGSGIQQANSLLASVKNIARLIGPGAAGLLTVSVGGGWAIAGDAASFLLAAVCFGRMALPDMPSRAANDPTMRSELREGRRYFSSRPWIWSVSLVFAVFNAANMGVWNILGPVMALDTIGADGWGIVLSTRGAGALLATTVMVKLTVRRPMAPALGLMTLGGLPLVLLGTGAHTFWLAASAFAAGVASEFFTVAWSTVWHHHVPEQLSTRVGAYDEFGSFASIPVGQLSVPVLAAVFGTAAVAVTAGGLIATAMLLPLLLPSLRRIEIGTSRAP
ncbi:MFS transporter [Streptomyces sp. ITFR-16]|uniref:MFS transporter n=1 Tax=Streptomyces sp. ITFR-16 TaxID=3075198 RepID=UPI00288A69F2|nr:MFS transporter [Streptomyces sp. ITFR-16]WNI20516.1 MFS transporter [Streptomyces sp. ITFR-16]